MESNFEQKFFDGASQFLFNEPTGQALSDILCISTLPAASLTLSYDRLEWYYAVHQDELDRVPKSSLVLGMGIVKASEALLLVLSVGAALIKTVNALNGNHDVSVDQITQHALVAGQSGLAICGLTWLQEKLQR